MPDLIVPIMQQMSQQPSIKTAPSTNEFWKVYPGYPQPVVGGNIQGAINQYFGLNAGGNTGFTQESAGQPGGTNILALLTQSLNRGGSPFAGAAGTETGGDIFKGLVA